MRFPKRVPGRRAAALSRRLHCNAVGPHRRGGVRRRSGERGNLRCGDTVHHHRHGNRGRWNPEPDRAGLTGVGGHADRSGAGRRGHDDGRPVTDGQRRPRKRRGLERDRGRHDLYQRRQHAGRRHHVLRQRGPRRTGGHHGTDGVCTTTSDCTAPTGDTATYPLPIPTAGSTPAPVTLYTADVGSGLGSVLIGSADKIGWWLSLPGNVAAGTYTSTIHLNVATGP